MTINVIYGTEKHGVTYRLTQFFLECFGPDVTINRFFRATVLLSATAAAAAF